VSEKSHKPLPETRLFVKTVYYIRKQRQCCRVILKCSTYSAVHPSITLLFNATRSKIIFVMLESYGSMFSFLLTCAVFLYICRKKRHVFTTNVTVKVFARCSFFKLQYLPHPHLAEPSSRIQVNTMI
jgi:hypothetical protein